MRRLWCALDPVNAPRRLRPAIAEEGDCDEADAQRTYIGYSDVAPSSGGWGHELRRAAV